MKFSRAKLIITNQEAELFVYDEPVFYDFENKKPKNLPRVIDEEKRKENRKRTLYRSKSQLRRLINANISKTEWPFFLTLTFKEAVTNLTQANYEFTKFIQRLNYLAGHKNSFLKYVAVPEIQKKREEKYGVGVWHFHLVLFNMPYIEKIYDKLNQIWGKGYLLYEDLKGVKNIGSYMSKYMSKDKNEPRLAGEKSYFSSNWLDKPRVFRDEKTILKKLEALPKDCPVFEKDYTSEYHGNIKYKNYQLKP